MNSIRRINEINQKELKSQTSYKASWHYEYRDTNYIYIGNIPSELLELDIIRIFSQFGIPTHINLAKNQQGNSRGFAFLKYMNFKSCILAIDNMNGVKVGDKYLRIDHNYYKVYGNDKEENYLIDYERILNDLGEPLKKVEEVNKKLIKSDIEHLKGESDKDQGPMANVNNKVIENNNEESKIESQHPVNKELHDPMADYIKSKKQSRNLGKDSGEPLKKIKKTQPRSNVEHPKGESDKDQDPMANVNNKVIENNNEESKSDSQHPVNEELNDPMADYINSTKQSRNSGKDSREPLKKIKKTQQDQITNESNIEHPKGESDKDQDPMANVNKQAIENNNEESKSNSQRPVNDDFNDPMADYIKSKKQARNSVDSKKRTSVITGDDPLEEYLTRAKKQRK